MFNDDADPFNPWSAARAATEYLFDAWQQTILTWDVLRERCSQDRAARAAPFNAEASPATIVPATTPARTPHWYFSELNPWMTWIKLMADAVRENRRPPFQHDRSAQLERAPSRQFKPSLDVCREAHDSRWLARFVRESTCA